ncbi:MAG: hypothetical protein AAF798_19280 [Bacteroidota bacterium]
MKLLFAISAFVITLGSTPLKATPTSVKTLKQDTLPNPWEQFEYIEVKKENEEFDKPFGKRQETEVIRQRKRVQGPIRGYETERSVASSSSAVGIPKIISIEPVASSDQLPPVAEVREDFDGYKIEILRTDAALQPDHELFFRHGNVQVHHLVSGSFSYVLGAFEDESTAQEFYDQYLGQRYPEGKVIQYEKGQRIE